MNKWSFLLILVWAARASAQLVISGNENKIDLASGTPSVVANAAPDSITLVDLSKPKPSVQHLRDIPNTVIGPPSNIAISPNGFLVLVANSVKIEAVYRTNWVPESYVHVLDLSEQNPKVMNRVATGRQPSGISFHPNGGLAFVANRADGTVSVLRIRGNQVEPLQTVAVCDADQSLSDVAVHPNGRLVLASVQKGGYLGVLEIQGNTVVALDRKVSVYGQPYRCVITPDGELGLTAGQGAGNGPDLDALSVVDLESDPIRTVDYVALGAGPESIEISPDGKLLAAVLMNGSNLPPEHPDRTEEGLLVMLARQGKTFEVVQRVPLGRIPEGVAFTADGKHLVVQCHVARQLWLFRVRGKRVHDTGERIEVPGMPSSLRAM